MNKAAALRTFYIGSAMYFFFSSIKFTVATVYRVEVVGLNPLQLVLVGTTLEAAYFLAEIPTGIVADLYSRKLSLVIGYALIGIGFAVEGLAPTFTAVLISQVIWGVGATFTSGAVQAWVAGEMGEDGLTAIFLKGGQIMRIASLVGILAGMGIGSYSLSSGFIISGLGLLALTLYFALWLPETGFKPTPREDRSTWQQAGHTFRMGLSHVRTSRILTLIFGIELCFGLASEGLDRLGEAHLIESFSLPTFFNLNAVIWLGIFSISILLLELLSNEILRRRIGESEDDMRLIRYLRIFSAGYALAVLLFAFSISFAMGAVMWMSIALLRGVHGSLHEPLLTRQVDQSVRATVLSMFGQVNALGQMVGGPLIGFVAAALSYRSGFVGVAAILLPVPFLYVLLLRWVKGNSAETTQLSNLT